MQAVYRVAPDVRAPDSAGLQGSLAAEDACAASTHPNPLYRREPALGGARDAAQGP